METKEFKIQVPEGYEIDKENSTFECIKFKPIKKDITYTNICIDIFVHNDKTTKGGFHIDNCGNIELGPYYSIRNTLNKNNATNKRQLERLLALNQLLNIAEYYNKKATEFNVKYHIYYNIVNCCYRVVSCNSCSFVYSLEAIFNDDKDAQAVIDNPNFREILDIIYKD